MTTTLDIRGLAKSFNGHTVLDHIDLQVSRGQHHRRRRLVGLRQDHAAAARRGLRNARRGNDHHRRATGGEPRTHRCAASPQRRLRRAGRRAVPAPHRRTEHRLRADRPGRSRGVRDRVAELLETVSLDASYAPRRPHQLSGGQQQRVALARALARKPVLMLLDEPFSALDTGLRASTRKAVAQLLADAGVTTLLVTHDQEEALSIADQVAVMRDGRFTQVGAPQQVYRQPNDRFTAEFLGDCVSLPCTVASGVADCALGRVPVQTLGRRRSGDADASARTARGDRGFGQRRERGARRRQARRRRHRARHRVPRTRRAAHRRSRRRTSRRSSCASTASTRRRSTPRCASTCSAAESP